MEQNRRTLEDGLLERELILERLNIAEMDEANAEAGRCRTAGADPPCSATSNRASGSCLSFMVLCRRCAAPTLLGHDDARRCAQRRSPDHSLTRLVGSGVLAHRTVR